MNGTSRKTIDHMPTRRQYLSGAALLLTGKHASSAAMDGTQSTGRRIASDWVRRRRRMLILGSSTAAGAGASSYSQSWAGRLTQALSATGFAIFNRSISGSDTSATLSRFERDTAGIFPGYVVLATSIINEFVLQLGDQARQTYVRNTKTLIREVERIGALPIVVGPFPNGAFNRNMRDILLQIYTDMAAEGVTTWNFMGACDNGLGRWLPGFSEDGLHPTDAGHQAMFESIPVSFFRRAADWPETPQVTRASGLSWRYVGLGCTAPLLIIPAEPLSSWTLSLWVNSSHLEDNPVIVAGPFEVALGSGTLTVKHPSGSSLAPVKADLSKPIHLCLTASRPRRALTVWVNDEAVLDIADVDTTTETFRFASEHTRVGTEYSEVYVYRAPLVAEDVRRLTAGKRAPASLEVALALNTVPDRAPLNAMISEARIEVCPESWQVVWSARTAL